ncbi:MAG: sensor histidine kinase [Saprospiraceae bacterium]|nr:sensor histidine kinase [Saprospiraceae bacterium]
MITLKSQMNPHFIFNTLNSIQSLIRFNKNKEAYKYVNKFATLLRQTLNYTNKGFITLENEIELLTNYLEMEKMRLDGQLTFEIHTIQQYLISIPYMIIQPFVENAIEHGLLHKKVGEKKIEIKFELVSEQLLCCTVTDNGIGREKAKEIRKKQLHLKPLFSEEITQNRLDTGQRLQAQNFGVEYIDLKDNLDKAIGTQVKISIPINTI